mmetsp:Transcript_85851/g.255982  ORF Transcript_85851/g.255982 Transcript_85851/m.255982 type:complete len:343 (+) Transcript_85851:558-1586(+)
MPGGSSVLGRRSDSRRTSRPCLSVAATPRRPWAQLASSGYWCTAASTGSSSATSGSSMSPAGTLPGRGRRQKERVHREAAAGTVPRRPATSSCSWAASASSRGPSSTTCTSWTRTLWSGAQRRSPARRHRAAAGTALPCCQALASWCLAAASTRSSSGTPSCWTWPQAARRRCRPTTWRPTSARSWPARTSRTCVSRWRAARSLCMPTGWCSARAAPSSTPCWRRGAGGPRGRRRPSRLTTSLPSPFMPSFSTFTPAPAALAAAGGPPLARATSPLLPPWMRRAYPRLLTAMCGAHWIYCPSPRCTCCHGSRRNVRLCSAVHSSSVLRASRLGHRHSRSCCD